MEGRERMMQVYWLSVSWSCCVVRGSGGKAADCGDMSKEQEIL